MKVCHLAVHHVLNAVGITVVLKTIKLAAPSIACVTNFVQYCARLGHRF